MQCTKPIYISGMWVPCGKCVNCRIALSRDWSMRILHEMQYWDKKKFVTFTYNDENLPKDCNLEKEELVKAFKRLRERLRKDKRKIMYYACGEYGEKFGRPHYHAIIFGIDENDRKLLEEIWPYGFISLGSVTYESARYVVDYIGKVDLEYFISNDLAERKIPFRIMSKGIGKRYVEEKISELLADPTLRLKGRTLGLPRYYVKKMKDMYSKHFINILLQDNDLKEKEKFYEKAIDKLEKGDIISIRKYKKEVDRQREMNTDRRINLHKKGKF